MADLPEGVIDVLDDVVRVVSGSGWGVDRLSRLAQQLTDARDERLDLGQVTAIVERDAPELASLVKRLLVPTDAGQFYTLVGVLVAILFAVVSMSGTIGEGDVQRITDDAVEQFMRDQPAPAPAPAPAARPPVPAVAPQRPASRPAASKARKRPPKAHGKNKKHKRR